MSDTIQLTSEKGILRISHALPELKPALSFRHCFQTDGDPYSYFDKKSGKMVTGVKRGKFTSTIEALYSEGSDGALYTHDGLLSTVINTLSKFGFEYEYERLDPQWPKPTISASIFKGLYPEQQKCVIKMLSSIGGCMVEAATSAGKTRIIAALVRAYPDQNIVIMTYRQSVVRGLVSNLTELLSDDGLEIGICQGSNQIHKRVTVATIGSAHHLDPSKPAVMIADELHRFASPGASDTWLSFNRAIKYGLSATITDRFDGKTKYLESLTGPMVFKLTDQELEASGRVPPITCYFLSVPEGPNIEHLSPATQKKRGIWKNSIRNKLIKEVVDMAPKDQQLMIFVETVEHLKEIVSLCPELEVCHGELPAKARKEIESRFTSGEAKRIISTDCLSEGVDPKKLMIMIDATGVKGDSGLVQKRGRLRRPGKAEGILIQFSDEWSEKLDKKAKNRIKEHISRGDKVIEKCQVDDIKFVDPGSSKNDTEQENL